MSRATEEEIKNQNIFCKQLSDRLYCDTLNFSWSNYQTNHTRIQNDIVRLRRELNTLSKMFDYDYREQKEGDQA